MTGIVLPGVSFPIPGAPSLSLSKYRPHESSDSNPTQNPPIRPLERDHNPLNPRSNKRSCFLCREKTDQTLDLGLRENVSCRLTLELVFERKLETKTVCHPCLSRFESLWSPIVEFKKIVPEYDKIGFNSDQFAEKDLSCVLCGSAPNRKSMNGCAVLSDRPDIVSYLSSQLGDSLNLEVYSKLMCPGCFRLVEKSMWMDEELRSLEIKINSTFSESRVKLEKDILVKSQDRSIDLNNLFIQVKSISLKDNIVNLRTLRSKPIPPGAGFSLQVITKLCSTKPGLETLELFTQDDKFLYLSLSSLRGSGITFHLDNSNLVVNLRDEADADGKYQCNNCDFKSRYFHILLVHLKTYLPETAEDNQDVSSIKLYKCLACGERFNRKSLFKTHNLLCKSLAPSGFNIECTECGKTFKSQESLNVHVAKVHNGSTAPWKCPMCEKGFTRKASYEEHIARHTGIKDKFCDICDKYYFETAYWRHMKLVHPLEKNLRFSCQICNKTFSQKFKLNQHLPVHMTETEKPFSCSVAECGKKFGSSQRLRKHEKHMHEEKVVTGSLVCGECGATYSNYSSMCGHIKRVHNLSLPRPLPCPLCPQTFSTSAALNKHKTIHHQPERIYFCGFTDCKIAFSVLTDLHRHQENCHISRNQNLEVGEEEGIIFRGEFTVAEPEDGRVNCVEGEIEIEDEGSKSVELELRSPSQHSFQSSDEPRDLKNPPAPSLEPELLLNPELSTLTEYPQDTSAPMLLQLINKPEQDGLGLENCSPDLFILTEFEYGIGEETGSRCESCLTGFPDNKELLNHLKTCKSVLSFKCSTCRREFATEARLEKHVKIHQSEKKFICPLCEKSFSTGKILRRHSRVHTGEKPYECEYCQKKFGSGSNLSEHRTLHTGRMAYSCQLCGGKYRLWSTYNKHRMKCEGKVGEESGNQDPVSHFILMNGNAERIKMNMEPA